MTEAITNRPGEDGYNELESKYSQDPQLIEKLERILSLAEYENGLQDKEFSC